MEAYCKVRGFPKRSAAEDFYLLNKVAKVGACHFAQDCCIQIQARLSDRVPFGTGPAVKRITEQLIAQEAVTYFNNKIFDELKKVLSCVDKLWHDDEAFKLAVSPEAYAALQQAGLKEFIRNRRAQDKSQKQFERSFRDWFDAFQTLKFVKRMQQLKYPPTPIT